MTEILNEKFFRLDVPNGTVLVHENPTPKNLMVLFNHSCWGIMRGLIVGDKVYWWDAAQATHSQVAPYLGVEDIISHIDRDGETPRDPRSLVLARERDGSAFLSIVPEMHSHPRLEKLLALDNVIVEEPVDGHPVY